MELHELADMVKGVADDLGITADVVGVTPSEGDGCYAEVILDLESPGAESRRVSVGLQRDRSPEDLRAQIVEELETD